MCTTQSTTHLETLAAACDEMSATIKSLKDENALLRAELRNRENMIHAIFAEQNLISEVRH